MKRHQDPRSSLQVSILLLRFPYIPYIVVMASINADSPADTRVRQLSPERGQTLTTSQGTRRRPVGLLLYLVQIGSWEIYFPSTNH